MNVGGPVSSVEMVLDGERMGVATAPRWAINVDLGTELAPHELVARALGESGEELARVRQWINLPRPAAEVEILVSMTEKKTRQAQLSWQSVTGQQPSKVQVTLNGRALEVLPQRRVSLPPHDPQQVQILSVELEFADGTRARKDLVLGGEVGDKSGSELTSVPIRVGKKQRDVSATDLRGVLRADAATPRVAAVEKGAALLVIVRDPKTSESIRGLGRSKRVLEDWQVPKGLEGDLAPFSSRFRGMWTLEGEDGASFLWPRAATYTGSWRPVELFPITREFTSKNGGVPWLISAISDTVLWSAPTRYADAVAVAGLDATGSFRRRAVLLVLDPAAEDESQHHPVAVRRFLESLRVPLFVWSLGPPAGAAADWAGAVDVSNYRALDTAFENIRKELAAQRIAWIEGEYLPQQVTLASGAEGIQLVR